MSGPLEGLRVLELAGIGPGPYAGQLLADLGAQVTVVHRPGPDAQTVDMRGKRSVVIDLRKPGAAEVLLKLAERSDALIEGNRPGVAERLGVGPESVHARNPKLVYGRMTGWGQTGPWSGMAGHDINYISLTGALFAMGEADRPPPPPLNLVGDYGGGSLFLVVGIMSALWRAQRTGKGEVVDAAIVDGVASMMGMFNSLAAGGAWSPRRQGNWLDGGAPYYRCYHTKDGGFMAVGAIEPKFFETLLEKLGLDAAGFGAQNDTVRWPSQHRTLEDVFLTKTRDEWAAAFDNVDACTTPVLSYEEAPTHPHNVARNSHAKAGRLMHPHSAPRFVGATDWSAPKPAPKGADSEAVLREAGLSPVEIEALVRDGVVVPRRGVSS
jgi:alpha-methylacyl-CoA racemase